MLEKDELKIFDSTAITPGTDFMILLDDALENFFKNSSWLKTKKIIYSSHLVPGEGEHKIFDYIRREDLIHGSGCNIILGLDNDLIILSVVSPMKNFFMKPEDGTDAVSVDSLRLLIYDRMAYEGAELETVIRDFCVVATLLGNDFLPKFPSLYPSPRKLIPLILKIYQYTGKPLTFETNDINWKNYLKFLITMRDFDRKKENLYVKVHKDGVKYPYPEIENNIIQLDKYGRPTTEPYDRTEHTLQFDLENFAKEWYQKQFNPEILQWDMKRVETYEPELIYDQCINYLKTIQWVQYYYTKGLKKISNFHYFHYLYTPLLESVVETLSFLLSEKKTYRLKDVLKKKEPFEITAVHQLLSVIPKSSLELIPKEFRKIYDELDELNPENFEVKLEGTNVDHEPKVLIPGPNLDFVNKKLGKNFKLPKSLESKKDIIIRKANVVPKTDFTVSMEYLI